MTSSQPKKRNAQVRTYWRRLQFAINHKKVRNFTWAKALYRQFQILKARIDRDSRDQIPDVELDELVEAACELLDATHETEVDG